MRNIRVKNGYDLRIAGKPSSAIDPIQNPSRVAALPERISFIKPRLTVSVGDKVDIGSVLFTDKRNPDLQFLSPGGGVVEEINFGPRRVIREIVIKLAQKESSRSFETIGEDQLSAIDKETVIRLLMEGGLWCLVRQLPFRKIADPGKSPPWIIVGLDNSEPFHPDSNVYLEENLDLFRFGLKVLGVLSENRVIVSGTDGYRPPSEKIGNLITHTVSGRYPAEDPGVLLYHIKRSAVEAAAWYINGQDLLLIAQLLKDGCYPTARTVVVAGSNTAKPMHFNTRLGVPLSPLAAAAGSNGNSRFVVGGVLRGYSGSDVGYMGLYETSLVLMPEGDEEEFLALFNPGYRKPSYSRAYLSRLNSKNLVFNCNRHGGDRACISCTHCAQVCPVEILPQFAYKAVLAGEVEESLEHGLLDCVECGLCSYVCPSKIELMETLKQAKAEYAAERAE